MTTYARLLREGDVWMGRCVSMVEPFTDDTREHLQSRVRLTFADGTFADEWSEARLYIHRPLYRHECLSCGQTRWCESSGRRTCCEQIMRRRTCCTHHDDEGMEL